jgi:lipoprotein NlpD
MRNQRIFARLGLSCGLVASLVLVGCASKSPAPVFERGSQQPAAPAPAPVSSNDFYTVKKGDTLYSIALDHGLGYKELAALNNLENLNRILIGQSLRIRAPAAVGDTEAAVAQPIAVGQSVEKRSLDGNADMLKREPKAGKEPYSDQALVRAQAPEQQKPADVAAATTAKPEVKPEATPAAKPTEAAPGADEVAWIWPNGGKIVGTFNEGASKGVDIAGKAGDPVLAAGPGKVVYSGTGLRGYGKLVIVKHNNTYLSAYAHNQTVLVKEGQSVSKGQKIAEMGSTDADQVKLHFEVRRQGKPVDPLKYLPQR